MSYDGTVRASEVFVPLTGEYILMTYFSRVMPLLAQAKHSHLENKSPSINAAFNAKAQAKRLLFIVVLGLDRLNEIFRSTLVPAFAKDSPLAGGAANFIGDHRSHRQVEVKPVFLESNGRPVKWTSNRFTFRASDLLNST